MKLIKFSFFFYLLLSKSILYANEIEFEKWKSNFKIFALKNNISEKTFNKVMSNSRFLPKGITKD